MRQHWMLLAMLFCVVPGTVNANETGARVEGPTAAADTRPSVRGMEFDVYIRLRNGMTEGELRERAGPPDHQTVDGSVGRKEGVVRRRESDAVSVNSTESIVKTFYYFPTVSDPFTTAVTTTGGRITDLQRERKF
jgi:hypothetical protein